MSVTANRVMEAAILLNEGEIIALPCPTYNAMESLRTQLYKVKQQLEKKHPVMARTLYISRKIEDNNLAEPKWTVFVTKETGVPEAFIIDRNGKAQPFNLLDLAEPKEEETEEERIDRLKDEDRLMDEDSGEAARNGNI